MSARRRISAKRWGELATQFAEAGMAEMVLIFPEDLPHYMVQEMEGCVQAMRILRGADSVLGDLQDRSIPCVHCFHKMTFDEPPGALVVALSVKPKAPTITVGLCDECVDAHHSDPKVLLAMTRAGFSKLFIECREVYVHSQVGHA